MTSRLRVALCHDWLVGMRGGERVLEVLCRRFPDAPIYTLVSHPSALTTTIREHEIRESLLRRLPAATTKYRLYLPLMPAAMEAFRPVDADLVLSTSHCVAKGLRVRPGARHLCYCFTPMRYAWLFFEEYFGRNPVRRMLLKPVLAGLRRWDRLSARRVDMFVAISQHVRDRIRRFYGRDAEVVYPPVDTDFWTPGTGVSGEYDLVVSAMVPYKRVDLVVNAYNRSGRQLKVVGSGPLLDILTEGARSNIEFLGWVGNDELRELYRGCRCLVFPGEEDFGLIPVEVQACGRPVVALDRGGATETVVNGLTGCLFAHQTCDSLNEAVERCHCASWDAAAIRLNAERFRTERFLAEMEQCIESCLVGVLDRNASLPGSDTGKS